MAEPAATQVPAVSRGGGDMEATTNPGGSYGAGPPCGPLTIRGTSTGNYRGEYAIVDRTGARRAYSGPLTLTVSAEVDANPTATYPRGSRCIGPPTAVPISGASLSGNSSGKSVSCSGYSGTFGRVGQLITIRLNGTCRITDGGVTYSGPTQETRSGRLTKSEPPGQPTLIGWTENYVATMTCTSPNPCQPPTTTSSSSTTLGTTTTTVRGGTNTTLGLGGPGGPAGPGGLQSASGPGPAGGPGSASAPGFTVTGAGGVTPTGPGTLGGLGTSVSSSGAASQVLAPGSASAPGSTAAAARGAVALPALSGVPQERVAPQHAMVAHQSPEPFPRLAMAAGMCLLLGFMCLVCVNGRRPAGRGGTLALAPAYSGKGSPLPPPRARGVTAEMNKGG